MASTEKAKIELEKIIELFSSKELTTTVSASYLEPTGKPSDKWTLANKIFMVMANTMDARGYIQWTKVGRYVKKGAKAFYILGPTIKKIKDEKTDEERSVLTGFHCIPVFRYEDTDGKELELVKSKPKEPIPLIEVADKWGVEVLFDGSSHGEEGSFNSGNNQIRICVDDPAGVFFHELAHKAHSRLEPLKGGQDPEQEAIAQLTACVLGRMYGYDLDNESYKYISVYSQNKTPESVGRMCCKVINKVGKVLDEILGNADPKDVPKDTPVDTLVNPPQRPFH